MVKINFNVTDEALLKAYRIGSLAPTYVAKSFTRARPKLRGTCSKWEDVDHDASDSVAGALTGSVQDTDVMDPLGLGGDIE
jgi:hypothetical protein